MSELNPFVVVQGKDILGYADVQPNGYIEHFFESGFHSRQGIGTLLMQRIHLEALQQKISHLSADVSITAQPFFSKNGFQLIKLRYPIVREVVLPNAHMRKVR